MKLKSKRLNKAVDEFAESMKQRLAEKESEGYRGWDEASIVSNGELLADVSKDVDGLIRGRYETNITPIDIANRLMMYRHRCKKNGASND